ncbi:hypothetical protein [Demequina sp. NBRC 110056]|nr:hypothetical protein [Demequina sp. NBRC 110056]
MMDIDVTSAAVAPAVRAFAATLEPSRGSWAQRQQPRGKRPVAAVLAG